MKMYVILLFALFSGFAMTLNPECEEDFTHHELVSAYCKLVSREKFYRHFDLAENCVVDVRMYKKEVMFIHCSFAY
jgi:hypothetical protein